MNRLGTDENPIDTTYYELFHVPFTANAAQIKKAYRKLALFKQISEAYQILSNPQLRAYYNKYGKDHQLALEGGFADPRKHLQQMFGGDAFKSIIGDLVVGEMFSDVQSENGGQKTEKINKEQSEKIQKQQQERIENLTEKLKHRLKAYTDSNRDEEAIQSFLKGIKQEAEKLKKESYGMELLHCIGGTYSMKAKYHLGMKGGGMPSIFIGIKQKKHIVKQLWITLKAAMNVQQAAELITKAEKAGIEDAEKMKLEEEITNKTYKALWQASKFEIETTLRSVCDKVLKDKTVNSKTRHQMAVALNWVGYIFKNTQLDSPAFDIPIKL